MVTAEVTERQAHQQRDKAFLSHAGRAEELIPKRRGGPRVTEIIKGVEGLKVLDGNPPNREDPKFEAD
jgi:hypothetical protein